MIDLNLIINRLPELLQATLVSLGLAAGALTIGVVGGTFLAIGESSLPAFGRSMIKLYTTLFRGTPMLIQIVFMYYIINSGLQLSAFSCALIAIGLNSSAYISQIIKAGMRSISYGQLEAAQTLGIPRKELLKHIILPQAFSTVLPALANEAITLIKDTSLASTIGVAELFFAGKVVIAQTYDALSVYAIIAIFYLTITISLSYLLTLLESKLSTHAADKKYF